jgi:hypothetical protein
MEPTKDEAPHYVIQRVREAFAHDSRVGELELGVDVRGSRLFVTGTVLTEERRDGVTEVAREVAPDMEIHNQVQVAPPPAPGDADVEAIR